MYGASLTSSSNIRNLASTQLHFGKGPWTHGVQGLKPGPRGNKHHGGTTLPITTAEYMIKIFKKTPCPIHHQIASINSFKNSIF
jgi:hypothetical protein